MPITAEAGVHIQANDNAVLRSIRWSDGTVQVSSPTSGGGGGSVSGAVVVGNISLSGQHADITNTTIVTSTSTGLYEITAYALSTAGDGGDTPPTLGFNWTDDSGGQNSSGLGGSVTIPTSGPGSAVQTSLQIESVSGQPIQYSVTGGTYVSAVYSLYISVIRTH